jgi:hypothetical protein
VDPLTKADAHKLEEEYSNPATKKKEKQKTLKRNRVSTVKFMGVVMDTLDRHKKRFLYRDG